MSETGLSSLYRLHKIDAQLVELKGHATALDSGQNELAEAKRVQAELNQATEAATSARKAVNDAQESARQLREKADKHEQQLYAGQIGPHHVEAAQADIAGARAKAEESSAQVAILTPIARESEAKKEALTTEFDNLRRVISKKRKAAQEAHATIEAEFKVLAAQRPEVAKVVPAQLLEAYESTRKRTGGIGMAVITPGNTCGACGVLVPEKSRVEASRDLITPCQSCRRILFVFVPSV